MNAMGEVYKKSDFRDDAFHKAGERPPGRPVLAPDCRHRSRGPAFIDQAVTAESVGAIEVRRRIKMCAKALLGPESKAGRSPATVSSFSAMTPQGGGNWSEHGDDFFASTLGAGGVPGTKFVWPDPGPKYQPVNPDQRKRRPLEEMDRPLQPEDAVRRTGSVTCMYSPDADVPEAYAIAEMARCLAMLLCRSRKPFSRGRRAAEGLKAGKVSRSGLQNGKDLGTVQAAEGQPVKMKSEFQRTSACASETRRNGFGATHVYHGR